MMTTIIFINLRKKDRPQRFHHNLWTKPEPICYRSHAPTAWVKYFPHFISNLDVIIYVSAQIRLSLKQSAARYLAFVTQHHVRRATGIGMHRRVLRRTAPSFTVHVSFALQSVESILHFTEISSNNRMETERMDQSLDYREPKR